MGALIIWLATKYIPDKNQYGFTQSLTTNAVTVSQILIFGLNYTLAVYVHKFATDDRKRKLLLTLCLLIPLILCIAVTIGYFLLHSWVIGHFQPEDAPYMQRYYVLLPIYILLFIYQLLLEQFLGSQMKVAVAAFMREVVVRLINIALLLLYAFNYIEFHVLVYGMVLMYVVPVAIFLILSFRTDAFGLSLDFNSFTRTEYKELISFSWYHFLLNMAIILMSYMDVLLLQFQGFGSVAVYRNAVFLISLLQIPSKALSPASFTVLAKAFSDNDLDKARDIFVRSSVNILIPTIAFAILITCNLHNVVRIIPNGYSEMIPLFLILAVGAVVNLATGMNDQVLSIANYYKFNFYLSLGLIAVLYVLIRLSVPVYGIYGAAWSTTITLAIFNFAKFLFIWKKLDMQPFSKNTVLVILAGLPALAAGYYFPTLFDMTRHIYVHSFMDAALRSLVIVIVYVVMLLWLKPSDDLVEYMASVKKNKRLF